MKGTELAKTIEPDEDYILPFGNANLIQEIWKDDSKETLTIVTYGMGVHWAINASKEFEGQVEIIDLRTLYPLDEEAIYKSVQKTRKCLVLTEEPAGNSFARSLSGLIQEHCFPYLDAPVLTMGSENMPAIPLNSILEKAMIPSTEKVKNMISELLAY